MENNSFIIKGGVLTKYEGPGGDIVIPAGVREIGSDAFLYCSGLTGVAIPEDVTKIWRFAFAGCDELESVAIPAGVTWIDIGTFIGCSRLESVAIPVSVTGIGTHAFCDCTNLTHIYYAGTREQWDRVAVIGMNDCLLKAAVHCADDGTDTKKEKHWR